MPRRGTNRNTGVKLHITSAGILVGGDRTALKREIEARQKQIGKSWMRICAEARCSDSHLRSIRSNPDYSLTVDFARDLEDALGWAHRSINTVLGGGKPSILLTHDGSTSRAVEARDILVTWSRRMSDDDLLELADHLRSVRQAGWRDGRKDLLKALNIEHDPADIDPNSATDPNAVFDQPDVLPNTG